MKVVIINGGPRKTWNTAKLLREAKRGAEASGAEVEYVDLFDLKYTGCLSCLACKRKGVTTFSKCFMKDELTSVLDSVWSADKLILGSPIYFGQPTGAFRSFFERVVFPALSYNTGASMFDRRVDVDVILTMGLPMDYYLQSYEPKMLDYFKPMELLNGTVRLFPVCDTMQVRDYADYELAVVSPEHKIAVRDTEFPKSLELAFQIGSGRA